jgi:hypothetical protein
MPRDGQRLFAVIDRVDLGAQVSSGGQRLA